MCHLSSSNDSNIYRVVGCGTVECHLQAMLTPSRMTDPNSTRTPKILPWHIR
jgi:hypothetical protein